MPRSPEAMFSSDQCAKYTWIYKTVFTDKTQRTKFMKTECGKVQASRRLAKLLPRR